MQIFEITKSSHAVAWFGNSFHAKVVKFSDWAAHKNFAVLVTPGDNLKTQKFMSELEVWTRNKQIKLNVKQTKRNCHHLEKTFCQLDPILVPLYSILIDYDFIFFNFTILIGSWFSPVLCSKDVKSSEQRSCLSSLLVLGTFHLPWVCQFCSCCLFVVVTVSQTLMDLSLVSLRSFLFFLWFYLIDSSSRCMMCCVLVSCCIDFKGTNS